MQLNLDVWVNKIAGSLASSGSNLTTAHDLIRDFCKTELKIYDDYDKENNSKIGELILKLNQQFTKTNGTSGYDGLIKEWKNLIMKHVSDKIQVATSCISYGVVFSTGVKNMPNPLHRNIEIFIEELRKRLTLAEYVSNFGFGNEKNLESIKKFCDFGLNLSTKEECESIDSENIQELIDGLHIVFQPGSAGANNSKLLNVAWGNVQKLLPKTILTGAGRIPNPLYDKVCAHIDDLRKGGKKSSKMFSMPASTSSNDSNDAPKDEKPLLSPGKYT
jgi:hypothetical protein